MKAITKRANKKAAFTIVELLTVMSIIIILIGLLVPALNMVKQYAKRVRQKAQFHSIDVAMELFNNEWDGYPDSDAQDEIGDAYCGALKLCEAMVGQDLIGFHPDSHFRSDGEDGLGNPLYATPTFDPATDPDNLKARKTYLQLENVHAYRLWNIYGRGGCGPFDEELFVLCDVYNRVRNQDTGKKIGMPILYYKADTSNTMHDPNGPLPEPDDDKDYIYNYHDNDELVELGMPWDSTDHPMFTNPEIFYEMTRNRKVQIDSGRPNRADSYILISAGPDGEYGTRDDIFNFGD
ncbi:MAG: type II secretion system protein [Planctomycetota bacterium]